MTGGQWSARTRPGGWRSVTYRHKIADEQVVGEENKGDDGADEGAKLEDGPEDTERLALVLLERVGHHYRTLGRPEEGGGDTEDRTSEDDEPIGVLSLVTGEGEEVKMSICLCAFGVGRWKKWKYKAGGSITRSSESYPDKNHKSESRDARWRLIAAVGIYARPRNLVVADHLARTPARPVFSWRDHNTAICAQTLSHT